MTDTEPDGPLHRHHVLRTRTTAQIGGVDDVWNTEEFDGGEEIDEAIEKVREDHDETVLINGDSIWVFEVHWNENTDSVWVGRYGYNGGMEVDDAE